MVKESGKEEGLQVKTQVTAWLAERAKQTREIKNNNYLVVQVEMFVGTPSLTDRMTVLSSCRCKSCDLWTL